MRSLIQLAGLFLLLPVVAHGEAGFWAPTVSNLPSAVVQVSKGVFEITVAGGEPRVFNLEQVAEMEAKIPAMIAKGQMSAAEKIVYAAQFDHCRKAKTETCHLMLMTARSSAFVVDGKVATALHAIEHYLAGVLLLPGNRSKSRAEKVKLIERMSIPIAVSTTGTSDTLAELRVARVFGEAIDAMVDGEKVPSVFDAVLLSVPPATNGLQTFGLARSPMAPKSQVYIVGYPRPTQDRQSKASAPDADGQLRVTKGNVLSLEDGYRRQGRDATTLLAAKQREALSQYLVLSDPDANVGLSGGPMLNERGEVIGIFGQGWPDSDVYAPNKMANGVQIERLLK